MWRRCYSDPTHAIPSAVIDRLHHLHSTSTIIPVARAITYATCFPSFNIAPASDINTDRFLILLLVFTIDMATFVDEKASPEPAAASDNDGLEENAGGVMEAAPVAKTAADKALVFKQDLRIVPLSAGIYLLCYLDRSNIGKTSSLPSSDHLLTSKRQCQNIEFQRPP
jgi:hypothetical protein